jgi:peptidoglycan/LPS O-acetylase OafA/YrhL
MSNTSLFKKHIPALDGIRGIAIIMVMVYHMMVIVPESMVGELLYKCVKFGWCGVDMFFVLSGFLITGILQDTKGKPGFLKLFYARRSLRIFPLYFGLLFFCLVVLPLFDHPKVANFGRIAGDEWWYFLYLQNYSIALVSAFRHGILDVTWSLAIEEQFYLLWPFVVLALRPKRLMQACVGLFALTIALRVLLLQFELVSPLGIYVLTPTRLDGLLVGAFLAIGLRDQVVWRRIQTYRKPVFWVSGLICLMCWVLTEPPSSHAALNQLVGYPALALFFGSVISFFVTGEGPVRIRQFLESRWLLQFGKYSYAMYLFHLPIRAVYRDWLFPPERYESLLGGAIPYLLVFVTLSILTTLLVAWLSWQFYEKQFLKLKRYVSYGKSSVV